MTAIILFTLVIISFTVNYIIRLHSKIDDLNSELNAKEYKLLRQGLEAFEASCTIGELREDRDILLEAIAELSSQKGNN